MKGQHLGGEARVYRPGVYFPLFVVVNSFLAYCPMGLSIKVWIGLMGVLLPVALALWSPSERESGDFPGQKVFAVPSWSWSLVLGLGLFLRFFGLTSLTVWPMWDDSECAFHSIQLTQHWIWKTSYDMVGILPLFFWLEALWFKCLSPSLFSLWLFPALLSVGALGIGYWGARRFFSPSMAFLFSLFLSLGFWPLYMGHFSIPACLTFFWEMGAWAFFANYFRDLKSRKAGWGAGWFGLWLAAGFYTSSKALPTVLVLVLAGLWFWWERRPRDPKILLAFVLPFLLTVPEWRAVMGDVSGGHAHEFMLFSHSAPWWEQLPISISYLTVFLWGVIHPSYYNFGPLWGGFFNPLLGAFLLLGVIEVFRGSWKTVTWGLAGTILIFLVPGLFSNTYEMMRILPLLPLFLVFAVIGCQRWLGTLPSRDRGWVLALLMVMSTGLDIYHLWGPYHQWSVPDKYSAGSKSPEHYQAFQVLERTSKEKGPGLVLSDLYYDVFDQSLLVATYPFNAAANPRLDPRQAAWAGIIIEPGDEKELQGIFPGLEYHYVSQGLKPSDAGMGLAIVPVVPENRERLLKWVGLHRSVQGLFPLIPYHNVGQDYSEPLKGLWEIYSVVPGEDYLQTCLLRRIMDLSARSRNLTCAMPLLEVPMERLKCAEPFRAGYGLVFLHMGMALGKEGQVDRMVKAFKRALYFDPRLSKGIGGYLRGAPVPKSSRRI